MCSIYIFGWYLEFRKKLSIFRHFKKMLWHYFVHAKTQNIVDAFKHFASTTMFMFCSRNYCTKITGIFVCSWAYAIKMVSTWGLSKREINVMFSPCMYFVSLFVCFFSSLLSLFRAAKQSENFNALCKVVNFYRTYYILALRDVWKAFELIIALE